MNFWSASHPVLYLFLYDLESVQLGFLLVGNLSLSSANNPPLLYLGYGPKIFVNFLADTSAAASGFANSHSFIIEPHLGFGIVSLLGFFSYVIPLMPPP